MRVSSINCLCCPTSRSTKLQNAKSRIDAPQEQVLFKGKAQKVGMGVCGALGLLAGCMLGPLGAITAGAIGALGGSILGAVDDEINDNNDNNNDEDNDENNNS